uniref:Putative chorion transcription factor cf2 n=1 Tax=Anopheles marajoara TaxID=58244 RepID=A0A2M4BCG7_9DIPT
MTRIGLRSNGGTQGHPMETNSSYSGLVRPSTETAMETTTVETASTGLADDAPGMVVAVEDVVSSIQQTSIDLLNGVTATTTTAANNNNNSVQEDDKQADKRSSARSDRPSGVIDGFAANDDAEDDDEDDDDDDSDDDDDDDEEEEGEDDDGEEEEEVVEQDDEHEHVDGVVVESAIHARDNDPDMRCYAATVSGDNEQPADQQQQIAMLVDGATLGETEITTEHSADDDGDGTVAQTDSGVHTETDTIMLKDQLEMSYADAQHQEHVICEQQDIEDEQHDEQQEVQQANVVGGGVKMEIMQTDDDPLLQETIKALMNGTGGIEVVNTSEPPSSSTPEPALEEVAQVATGATEEQTETDRNYECNYCGKLFTRSNTLSYHVKVHTGERPFKCKYCSKAFREHYRLTKHMKTHSISTNANGSGRLRERSRAERREQRARIAIMQSAAEVSGAATADVSVAPDEEYTTGDSERFFKTYDIPGGTGSLKFEPDISLTVEGGSDATVGSKMAMLEETVEASEYTEDPANASNVEGAVGPATESALTGADVSLDGRYQIIEERVKSLQREVHLVNQNLNRVESKVDGLTRLISLFIGKFEEEPAIEEEHPAAATPPLCTATENMAVTTLSVVSSQTATPTTIPSSSSTTPSPSPTATTVTAHPKATLLLTSTTSQHNSLQQQQQQHNTSTMFEADNVISTITSQPSTVPQQMIPVPQLYRFTESIQAKPHTTITLKTSRPATPASLQQQQQQLQTHLGHASGNQLLDTFPEIPELPIRTVSDFLDLNDHCTDNEQFLLQMMIRLHQEIHNSQPFQRNIKRMMEALVTYEVLCQFSWSGKSAINGQYTKYVFGNSLGIIDLLTKTLNLGKSAQEAEANQKPIFAAIQSFIKHSRQNMIRDSRKRRDPSRAGSSGTASVVADSTTTTSGSYLIPPAEKRLSAKQIKTEYQQHVTELVVNPF